jgi:hypothetical protein
MRLLLFSFIAAFILVIPFGSNFFVQAEDTPSISEFTNCVSFFTRKLSVRENKCKWYEFEISVNGGSGNEVASECPCFTEFQLRNGFKNTSTETLGQLCTRDTDRDLLDPPEDFRDVFIVKAPGDIFYARVSRTDDSGDNQFATCQFNPTDSNEPGFLNNGEFITLEEADICIDLILAFEQDASLNGCL